MQKRAGNTPEVSVIIPTHDQRQEQTYRAVRSALGQREVSLEVIVVDDGSKPAFSLPPDLDHVTNLKIVRRDVNGGAAAARNQGAAEARGAWLAFLDSDDTWNEDKLARQLAWAAKQERGRPIVVSSGFRLIANGKKASRWRRSRALIPAAADNLETFASGCWFCPGSTALMQRDVFHTVGPFDTNLQRLEDLDWYLRFAMLGGVLAVAPSVLVDVHVGSRPSAEVVCTASKQLLEKYQEAWGAQKSSRRALTAYLALEKSAAYWYEQRPLPMLWHLLYSWLLMPRWRLHLLSYWQYVNDSARRAETQ